MYKGIYLNNAGTSFPKPPVCGDSLNKAFQWAPSESWEAIEAVTSEVKQAFKIPESHQMFFTNSCTAGINILLNSMAWTHNDCIISSGMEHYACSGVISSLVQNLGVVHKVVTYRNDDIFCLAEFEKFLSENTVKLVVCCHGGNLTGDVFPLAKIVEKAHAHGALVLADFAQTAGVIPIDVTEFGVDLCAFTGHKGLLGPLGTGIISINSKVPLARAPASCDFTRKTCQSELSFCDIGSLNIPATIALGSSIRWLKQEFPKGTGIHTKQVYDILLEGLKELPLKLFHAHNDKEKLPIISFVPKNSSPQSIARQLSSKGFHIGFGELCAPLAHKSLATEGTGLIRVSPSIFNTEQEIIGFVEALSAAIA